MRVSHMLLPTVKEDPAGAEAVSHKLMVRAGLVRQLGAGIYIYLPAGWRVMRKIEQIIREEMQAIGCQELLMPVVNPAELWQESGRYDEIGDELFRFKDRKGSPMVLAMTHEECITWIAAREVRSYKQLPQLWYHFQTKERDEARPKSGVLRTREFIMKDSYSLDVSEAALQESYRKHIAAYDRIYARCGVQVLMVQSDPGMMGGRTAHEYMAPSEAGEDDVVFCSSCGYAANVELAQGTPAALDESSLSSAAWAAACEAAGRSVKPAAAPVTLPAATLPSTERLRLVHTPATRTIEQVTTYLGLPASRLVKSLIVVTEPAHDTHAAAAYMVLVRGDHELQESKLRKVIGDFRLATAQEVQVHQGAEAGFVGPVRLREHPDGTVTPQPTPLAILADLALQEGVYVAGGNVADQHLLGVVPADWCGPQTEGGAASPTAACAYHDLRKVVAGDGCPQCAGSLCSERVIEVGNIFQLGTKYSKPMGATFLDENGVERPIVMGSYGIGLARIAAAAVEQNHDADGIVWPVAIAPFQVHLICVKLSAQEQRSVAEDLYEQLQQAGLEVVYDDRDVSAGIKFKDADLLGCPVQLVVGRGATQGVVELKQRATGGRDEVPIAEVLPRVATLLDAAPL